MTVEELLNIPANRNWAEDAEHENGNYENICACCKLSFIGHKRRYFCKVCYTYNPHTVAKAAVAL